MFVVVVVYLATVWLDGVGSNWPARAMPRIWVFFAQYAALFAHAGLMTIDYRAEGWSCSDKRWVELDVKPWFRIDAENKESRFHRALFFYRKDRRVMRELEEYVIQRNNESASRPAIIGVRFSSLRIPYPPIGSHVDRDDRKPLASYPREQRHSLYYTPMSKRRARCGEPDPPKPTPAPADDETSPDGGVGPGEPEP
jgi:hypothetical protein